MVSYRFGLISSSFSLVTTLLFLLLGGFTWADELARSFTSHPTVIALLFFAIVMGASSLLQLPFDYYRTFTIESQFGFNKSSRALFFMDKVKGLLIGGLFGRGTSYHYHGLLPMGRNTFLVICVGYNGPFHPTTKYLLQSMDCSVI